MDAGDASPADMRRSSGNRDADPLALDEATVERLVTGALPPDRAPAGYARVAPVRPSRRRRRTGLAVVVVVGALATGGVAGAATGHLPAPVRDAARAITGAGTGTPSLTTGQPPASATGAPDGGSAGAKASRPGWVPGSGEPGSTGAGPAAGPALRGLCEAFVAGDGVERGGKLDATAFEELAKVAGGEEQVAAYCEELLPGDQKLKETKKSKPEQPEQPDPSGSGGQTQGGPPASTGRTGGPGQGGPGPGGDPAPQART